VQSDRGRKGKFKPRGDKKAALVALRRLRKREVRKLLAEKARTKVKAKRKRPGIKPRKEIEKKSYPEKEVKEDSSQENELLLGRL
jgi:hypothetical protein